eukprot:6179817-Pleurochrysis_carterae.AAC.4
MASAIEAMGMSLPYSSCTPAYMKAEECTRAGKAMRVLLEKDIKVRIVRCDEAHNRPSATSALARVCETRSFCIEVAWIFGHVVPIRESSAQLEFLMLSLFTADAMYSS